MRRAVKFLFLQLIGLALLAALAHVELHRVARQWLNYPALSPELAVTAANRACDQKHSTDLTRPERLVAGAARSANARHSATSHG